MRLPVATGLVLVLALGGCARGRMRACEPCIESADCEDGLTCQQFRDHDNGNPRNLCGDANPDMTCPDGR